MKTKILPVGLALIPFSALLAANVTSNDVQQIEHSLKQLNSQTSSAPCSSEQVDSSLPNCSSLTDGICDRLWNAKNQGNLDLSTGSVKIGETGKSRISANYRMDVEALLENEPRLPADLRKQAGPMLSKLRALMKRESSSKQWLKDLSKIMDEWDSAFDDVAKARAEAQMPLLKKVADDDLTTEQKAVYAAKSFELNDEILRTKYENSPRWKNVERIFDEAKSDVISVVQGLEVPDDIKHAMLEKVQSVKLTLPYTDPRKLGTKKICATTERNARYFSNFNKVTICAGYFNSYQSPSNLYATLAHEISHSIDPVNFLSAKYEKTPVAQTIGTLSASDAAPFSCDQWKQLLDSTLRYPKTFSDPQSPFQTLTDCLAASEDKLLPFTAASLESVSKRAAASTMNFYASGNLFLWLAQPTLMKKGKSVKNEFYLRPDRVEAALNHNLSLTTKNYVDAVSGVFVQTLSCTKLPTGDKEVSFVDANPEQRKQIFQTALETSKQVQQVVYATKFSNCGRECSELVSENLSRNVQENFADWVYIKALPKYLARETSINRRRELAGLVPVDMCSMPGPEQSAPELAAAEKAYSYESHPDNRIRRLSVFSPEVAQVVSCKLDEEAKKGFSSCHF